MQTYITQSLLICCILELKVRHHLQGRIQKIQKEGAESPTLSPEWKLHFPRDVSFAQHCGRIGDAQ